MKEKKTLGVVLGERLSALRVANGKRQEDIAVAARFWGLPWTRATVAGLELGRRQLSVEEFLLLPGIFLHAGLRITEKGRTAIPHLGDLFRSDAWVVLSETTTAPPDRLQELFSAHRRISPLEYPYVRDEDVAAVRASPGGTRAATHRLRLATFVEQAHDHQVNDALIDYLIERTNPEDVIRALDAFQDQHGDAELTAARKLKTTPYVVALAALRHWGRSLTVERDTRLAGQVTNETTARSVQAIRGHLTRELLAELVPHVQELVNKSHAPAEMKAG